MSYIGNYFSGCSNTHIKRGKNNECYEDFLSVEAKRNAIYIKLNESVPHNVPSKTDCRPNLGFQLEIFIKVFF